MGTSLAVIDQVDLFLETALDVPWKDDQALMAYPFFSLSKSPRKTPIIYEDGTIRIEVRPGDKGLASIWDKDVLMYITSLLNSRLDRGEDISRTVRFHAFDLLRSTGRSTGKKGYELLFDALYRLRSTTVLTTIQADGKAEKRGFGWIESFRVITRVNRKTGGEVMSSVEVTLNDWMFRAITKDRRVLSINSEYYSLRKGLERALYGIARKHCGRQPKFTIALDKLAHKTGTVQGLAAFKRDLKKVIDADNLPDYRMTLLFDPRALTDDDRRIMPLSYTRRYGSNKRILVVFTPKQGAGGLYVTGSDAYK